MSSPVFVASLVLAGRRVASLGFFFRIVVISGSAAGSSVNFAAVGRCVAPSAAPCLVVA
jgi:hypothetical protein